MTLFCAWFAILGVCSKITFSDLYAINCKPKISQLRVDIYKDANHWFYKCKYLIKQRYLCRCVIEYCNNKYQGTNTKQIIVKKAKYYKNTKFPSRNLLENSHKKIWPKIISLHWFMSECKKWLKKKKVEKSKFSKNM